MIIQDLNLSKFQLFLKRALMWMILKQTAFTYYCMLIILKKRVYVCEIYSFRIILLC